MFMNKRQIVSAYKKGQIDDVAKQLRRYGTIIRDKEWHEEAGYHAGAHRVMSIRLHSLSWEIHLHNGDVKRLGYDLSGLGM